MHRPPAGAFGVQHFLGTRLLHGLLLEAFLPQVPVVLVLARVVHLLGLGRLRGRGGGLARRAALLAPRRGGLALGAPAGLGAPPPPSGSMMLFTAADFPEPAAVLPSLFLMSERAPFFTRKFTMPACPFELAMCSGVLPLFCVFILVPCCTRTSTVWKENSSEVLAVGMFQLWELVYSADRRVALSLGRRLLPGPLGALRGAFPAEPGGSGAEQVLRAHYRLRQGHLVQRGPRRRGDGAGGPRRSPA